MRARMLVLAAAWLAACSTGNSARSSPPPQSGAPTEPAGPAPGEPARSGSGGSAAPAPAGPKIGDTCGANDACGEGTCVTYYGIAGPRGPQFKSCEIRCDGQGGCSGGRACVQIADGPGAVCR